MLKRPFSGFYCRVVLFLFAGCDSFLDPAKDGKLGEEDIWNYTTPDGKNIDKGIAWLYPYVKDKSSWKRQPDIMFWEEWPVAQPFLLFGTLHHFNKEFFNTWMQLEHFPTNEEVVRNLPIRHPLLWIQ